MRSQERGAANSSAGETEPVWFPRAILHVEPDLWGYGHQVNDDPEQIPVALSAAGAAECTGLPDTLGGFARCLVAIARAQAPNVLVGLHASAWGAGVDAINSSDPGLSRFNS